MGGRLSEAERKLREKPCLCAKGVEHYGPHKEGCPRFIDRSQTKEILAALVEKRHNEREGEWINLVEFHNIDLFSFRLWGEWPDAKMAERAGIEKGRSYHRRVAYEIKVSRADFRREMRRPSKRQGALDLTHQFYFATPPGLVKKEEVPEECGLVWVEPGGVVKLVKRAPIRKPPRSFTMSDVTALLRAKHVGPSYRQLRDQARRSSGLLKEAEGEYKRAQHLLRLARVRLLREKGSLLVAGSEWIGPRAMVPHMKGTGDVSVVLTSARVNESFEDEPDEHGGWWADGTIYIKPQEDIERDGGEMYGGQWMDAGDFLIAFRHVSEPAKVAPPPPTSLHSPRRPRLAVVDGQPVDEKVDDEIVF